MDEGGMAVRENLVPWVAVLWEEFVTQLKGYMTGDLAYMNVDGATFTTPTFSTEEEFLAS